MIKVQLYGGRFRFFQRHNNCKHVKKLNKELANIVKNVVYCSLLICASVLRCYLVFRLIFQGAVRFTMHVCLNFFLWLMNVCLFSELYALPLLRLFGRNRSKSRNFQLYLENDSFQQIYLSLEQEPHSRFAEMVQLRIYFHDCGVFAFCCVDFAEFYF